MLCERTREAAGTPAAFFEEAEPSVSFFLETEIQNTFLLSNWPEAVPVQNWPVFDYKHSRPLSYIISGQCQGLLASGQQ